MWRTLSLMKGKEMQRNLSIGLLLVVLAGCGQEQEPASNDVEPMDQAAYENRLETMPEGQRNAVFIRAIRDAGLDCQHVSGSAAAGEYQGMPVWTASCDGGQEWTIVLGAGGVAQILNPAEARLVSPAESPPK
ncbi:hypothetical protein [Sphingosinicella rhizophila]|uniref:Lipoprotein n=1 Tax=Sphingosinicella rhizophila TaxID=3050082 RepID=A0ABU3Q6H5_9SPHN|nr:hypothetical protein [Sphingosinicella sp. GR2756]MDT9599009.1 hypothetical protein [Sphingosinicella sp. GR2756]